MAKRSGKFYYKNEKEVMESLGLKQTKGSGSGWLEKEDGQNEYVLAQLKSTDAASMRVQKKDINLLEYNAAIAHKVPIFVIQFLKTNELFIMARPEDIPSIASYIECGECKVKEAPIVVESKTISAVKIKSGNRDRFWKAKQKEWEKVGKKGKH